MNTTAWCLNTAWMLKCQAEATAFERASRNVADTQARLLRRTLHANRCTEFGRTHDFAKVVDARMYQERVPLATFEDFAPAVERIVAGVTNILTSEPIRLLEPTSGTTGGEKLIPYTTGLRRQFQRGVAAWIADLFRNRPTVRRGRAYWSISPALGPPRRNPGGPPIGFDGDDAYLGWAERSAMRRLLVAPGPTARPANLESFRYATLLSLLAAGDLALISVWSPTFLTALIAPLDGWQERLCHDLRRGTLSPPAGATKPVRRWRRPDPARADRLARILRAPAPWGDRLRLIWPQLALISCWGDAAAARFLPEMKELFPGVEVQPKGLLATEGFVSFPLMGRPAAALAVRCHFFEFEEESGGPCRLAHDLDRGGSYRVVLTTAGGLYRYRLGDEVEVVGFHHQCPFIRFVGKGNMVSDLVGEKLAEPHVRVVLERLAAIHALQLRFALLTPVMGEPARYRLYLQASGLTNDSPCLGLLRVGLEQALRENPYYRQAIVAAQLAPVEVTALDAGGLSGWLLYERRCIEEGQKCGNIKPTTLDGRNGWPQVFACLEDRSANCRK